MLGSSTLFKKLTLASVAGESNPSYTSPPTKPLKLNQKTISCLGGFDTLKESKKVTVVALAKNEAAYIPEWVHHHFYFGVDKIVIGINRTDDNTDEVVQCLNRKYGDRLEVINVDFIDKSIAGFQPRLQQIGYAYLVDREHKLGSKNEILVLDIDEFWFSTGAKMSISDYLEGLPSYDIVSFHWVFEFPNDKAFSLPFSGGQGYLDTSKEKYFVKTLFKPHIYDDVEIFAPHRPKTSKQYVRLDANGEVFEPYQKGFTTEHPDLNELKSFILHRIKRSEVEYLAAQNKPDFTFPDKVIRPRTNSYRNSFNENGDNIKTTQFSMPDEYFASLERVLRECELHEPLSRARKKIAVQAASLLDKDITVIKDNLTDFLFKTNGTYMFLDLIKLISVYFNESDLKTRVRAFCLHNKMTHESLIAESKLRVDESPYVKAVDALFVTQ